MVVQDEPSKWFLFHRLRCKMCGAQGVQLVPCLAYRWQNHQASIIVQSLICVPCHYIVLTGGRGHPGPAGPPGPFYTTTVNMRLRVD